MLFKIKKTISKLFVIWTLLLLFILEGVFPEPAYAFLSSLDACAVKPECATAVGSELSPAIVAPTAEAAGTTAISTTTATGATSSAVEAVAGTTVVGDMRLSGVVAFYIWNQAQNQRAQEKAKDKYCQANPKDEVCAGRSSMKINYRYERISTSVQTDAVVKSNCLPPRVAFTFTGQALGVTDGSGYFQVLDGIWNGYKLISHSEIITVCTIPNLPWKNWHQQKRNTAVNLLNNSDWQGLISSMPAGGILNPGDKINAPTIVIPGQETDDPNTPPDERLLKKESGFFTNPGGLDTDFDKDGTPDSADPEPQNPNIPTASGGDNSTDQPPDDSSNPPLEQDGPDDQAQETRIGDDQSKTHAEIRIISWAEANGKTVESIGASRNICSACWAQMQPRNIRPATHVNLPQTQQ